MNASTNWSDIINEYDKVQSKTFKEFLDEERKRYEGCLDIYPLEQKIFRCFNYFNIEDTKVVILGQDPYHGPNQATGLCFDINKSGGGRYPPSLRNIEKVLGKTPDFEAWAHQGVLLLNTALTVVQGNAGSHIKYWKPFTQHVVNQINQLCDNVIFIVWGAFAMKIVELVDAEKHRILISSHPSPLSYTKQLKGHPAFKDSDIFNKITTINW